MRNWTMAIVPLALAMTASGCNGSVTGGNDGHDGAKAERSASKGPVTTQSFALQDFIGVELAGPDDVTIRQGTAFSISARGPKNELEELEIKRDGGMLSIGRKREGFSLGSRDHDGVEISITMPRLTQIKITGSGEVDADTVDGDAADIAVTGSGDLKVAKLTAKNADIAVSGSGDVEIGGGTIATGDYSVTGSGNIDADALVAQNLDISITGSGDVDAHATGKADVTILGSGDVTVKGGATCSTSQVGSGSTTCK